jgi:creatinine amidohydrolase
MRFTNLTALELRALQPQVAGVFIPLGCTEQQGPHLPTDFDSWMIERLCEGIAQRLYDQYDIIVLTMPTLPFGPTPEHIGFGHGYVDLRQSTHEAVIEDVLESLVEQGYRRLLIWRGCGQHQLSTVIDAFNLRHTEARASQPQIDYNTVSQEAFGRPIPGGHADSFATSIRLYLDADSVRLTSIRLPQPAALSIDWSQPLDFSKFSDTGVIGDPTQASPEVGAKLWEMCLEAAVALAIEELQS